MCDRNHKHGLLETWITPRNSERLKSKLVQMPPGAFMPEHSTGPGREEVIICIFGTLTVKIWNERRVLTAGEACFIPENTPHAVANNSDEDHALYAYVVSILSPNDRHDVQTEKLFAGE